MKDKILKISVLNFLRLHFPTIILIIIGIAVLYYLKFDEHFVQVFLVIWIIDLLPAIYLHVTYFLINKGEKYEIRDNELILYKKGEVLTYKNEEVEKIIIYLSPALYKNSDFHLLMIESYHYAVIELKTGEKLILTCLFTPRVDKSLKQIKGVLFEKRKRLFCYIG